MHAYIYIYSMHACMDGCMYVYLFRDYIQVLLREPSDILSPFPSFAPLSPCRPWLQRRPAWLGARLDEGQQSRMIPKNTSLNHIVSILCIILLLLYHYSFFFLWLLSLLLLFLLLWWTWPQTMAFKADSSSQRHPENWSFLSFDLDHLAWIHRHRGGVLRLCHQQHSVPAWVPSPSFAVAVSLRLDRI